MRKEIYLVQGLHKESYPEFEKRILSCAERLVKDDGLSKLKVSLTKEKPPLISIIPFKKNKIAAISLERKTKGKLHDLEETLGFAGSYLVEEAVPVAYQKDWPDSKFTPGICLLTLFRQRIDISRALFLERWHHGHTPLSLKIHPLWNYNRNVVLQQLNEVSDPWDGIVEEQFETKSDLLNPLKFFGNPLVMPYRMWQVYADVRSFLEYNSIEPFYSHEIYIKS